MNISSIHKPRNKSKKNKTKRLNRRIKGGPRKYKNKRTNRRVKKRFVTKKYKRTNKLKQRGKQKGGGRLVPDIAINIIVGQENLSNGKIAQQICSVRHAVLKEINDCSIELSNLTNFFKQTGGGPVFLHLPNEQFSVTDDGLVDGVDGVDGVPLIEYYWNWVKGNKKNKSLCGIKCGVNRRTHPNPTKQTIASCALCNDSLFFIYKDKFRYYNNYNNDNKELAKQQWAFLMAVSPLIYKHLESEKLDYWFQKAIPFIKAIKQMCSRKIQNKFKEYKNNREIKIPFTTLRYHPEGRGTKSIEYPYFSTKYEGDISYVLELLYLNNYYNI